MKVILIKVARIQSLLLEYAILYEIKTVLPCKDMVGPFASSVDGRKGNERRVDRSFLR